MGKHRPVSERIAEVQAQLAALQAKSAKADIESNPEIQQIDAEIKKIQVSTLKFNRWAAEGADKVENFRARAREWENRLEEATKRRDEANKQLTALRLKRKHLAEQVAANLSEQDA
jgi:chromosome segregation ATPase